MKKSRETKQKIIVHEVIQKTNSFFTAEKLLKKVEKIDSKIGIATIYRFLKEQRKKGKLHSYICDRKTLYSKDDISHCHFICKNCGKKEHFQINSIDFIRNKIEKDLCHIQLDVYGFCDNCKSKK